MVKSEAKRLAPQHLGAARDKWADGMEWPKLRGVEGGKCLVGHEFGNGVVGGVKLAV